MVTMVIMFIIVVAMMINDDGDNDDEHADDDEDEDGGPDEDEPAAHAESSLDEVRRLLKEVGDWRSGLVLNILFNFLLLLYVISFFCCSFVMSEKHQI